MKLHEVRRQAVCIIEVFVRYFYIYRVQGANLVQHFVYLGLDFFFRENRTFVSFKPRLSPSDTVFTNKIIYCIYYGITERLNE